MKIIFADTYYSEVFKALAPVSTYTERNEQLANLLFGTSSFYSEAFAKYGWEAIDLVANDEHGRRLWEKENDGSFASNIDAAIDQIITERPDVLYCQDLSFIPPGILRQLKERKHVRILAGQCSCPWPGDEVVASYDVLFTSFPHYLERFRSVGVRAEFLPIAFGDSVLNRVKPRLERPFPITFVGGIGRHWKQGEDTLRMVAEKFPNDFRWWGYGADKLPAYDPLRKAHLGEAWGVGMYEIYAQSQIVVNRHGEVAEGKANNMRIFEASGMGALLFTEYTSNLWEYLEPNRECIGYINENDLLIRLEQCLEMPELIRKIADAGMVRTHKMNTYNRRLEYPSQVLKEMICE